ncbi:MAG: hypothetical protein OIF51_01515 [Cellvibrionaceae bacterium]|nr:hypothetical protein [Cellvibrionaceae bacterium]
MEFDINSLKYKQLKILSKFEASECSYESVGLRNDNNCFYLKNVSCKCGNNLLRVITTITKKTKKGLFKSKETIEYLAPIHLECSKCQTGNLLFDPQVHGWDGESGNSASLTGEDGELIFNDTPARIYVELSYQGEENYGELAEDGIANIQDYFDTFGLYVLPKEATKAIEVVSYECA